MLPDLGQAAELRAQALQVAEQQARGLVDVLRRDDVRDGAVALLRHVLPPPRAVGGREDLRAAQRRVEGTATGGEAVRVAFSCVSMGGRFRWGSVQGVTGDGPNVAAGGGWKVPAGPDMHARASGRCRLDLSRVKRFAGVRDKM